MSARSPLTIIRSQVLKSRQSAYAKEITDPVKQAEFIRNDLFGALNHLGGMRGWLEFLVENGGERLNDHADWKREIEQLIEDVRRSLLSPKLIVGMIDTAIRDMITNRKEQTGFDTPDLFRDLHYQFAIRGGKGRPSIGVELGDVDLDTIPLITKQKNGNLESVRLSLAAWEFAASVVGAVLKKHKEEMSPSRPAHQGWVWRDACNWLEANGKLPAAS